MPISTAAIDRRIARLQKKLDGFDAIQAEIKRLQGLRSRVEDLENEFPIRKRQTKKTGRKKR